MKIENSLLRKIIEGTLLAADTPLNVAKLAKLFEVPEGSEPDPDDLYEVPGNDEIMAMLEAIQADCAGRGYELKQVGSGWRFQVVQEVALWINRLWEEKPQRYSRALLETVALIAYRQPITRGDIESIRGVAVSSNIIRTLTEREWVKVVGHRDVPGRPALYATTRQFLDYFNLKNLDELPSLKEIQDLDKAGAEFELAAALAANSTLPENTALPDDTLPDDALPEAPDAEEGEAVGESDDDTAAECEESEIDDAALLDGADYDHDESDDEPLEGAMTLDEPFGGVSEEPVEAEAPDDDNNDLRDYVDSEDAALEQRPVSEKSSVLEKDRVLEQDEH